MSAVPPNDGAIDVSVPTDTPIEVVPRADYVARADAQDSSRHAVLSSSITAVTVGANRYMLGIVRDGLPDTTEEVVKVRLHLSTDGGGTFRTFAHFGTIGGVLLIPGTHDVLASSEVWGDLPEPDNPNRLLLVELIPYRDINAKCELTLGKA